jgi:hypothetical protein
MATSSVHAFEAPSRARDAWHCAGSISSFPNIAESGTTVLSEQLPCHGSQASACKILRIPRNDDLRATQVSVQDGDAVDSDALFDQVLVFRYKYKFYAVDHVSLTEPALDLSTIQ